MYLNRRGGERKRKEEKEKRGEQRGEVEKEDC